MATTFENILRSLSADLPQHWPRYKTIDMHTGGEPLRVIVGGLPGIEGSSILEKRRYMLENHDDIRKLLMYEPRGHMDMYGCILVAPSDPAHDFGILFTHNEGYSTMCGHAIIAITKLAFSMGWKQTEEPIGELAIEAPCGLIKSYARIKQEQVVSTYFDCVPSFVVATDNTIDLPNFGSVKYDIAYGGAFYAYVESSQLDLKLIPAQTQQIVDLGMQIKNAVMNSVDIQHPFEGDLSFLYGTIFIDDAQAAGIDSRNVCVFAEGEVDRSPTGSGVSGRMALHHSRSEIQIGQEMKIESIIGSVFTGSVVETMEYGPYNAVIPRVEGTAYITGMHEFVLDPDDPFSGGFLLR